MSFYSNPIPLSKYPSFQSRCIALLDRTDHYTSPNENSLPNPLPLCGSLPLDPSAWELRTRIWSDNRYPYLPFIFNSPLFGSAMDRFNHFGWQVLEHGSQGWHLPMNTAKSWKTFEHGLRKLSDSLVEFMKKVCPHISSIWEVPKKPGEYGYFSCHPTQDDAYVSAVGSIDGFVVYSAYVSFLIVLCRLACPRSPLSFDDLFRDPIFTAHPDWIHNILDSGIGDITPPRRRMGAIVDVKQCSWLNLIPFMIKAGIPLWFYWGQPPFICATGSWLSVYRPNETTVFPQSSSTAAPLVSNGFPSVVPGSGQRPGELMDDFFKRRAEENSKVEQKETFEARQKRLDREMSNSRKTCPGNRGPRVYRWEEVDGYRIRQLVSRKALSSDWGYYKKSQIRYDAFANEYDCCSEFDGDVGGREDYESDYSAYTPPRKPATLEHNPSLDPSNLPRKLMTPEYYSPRCPSTPPPKMMTPEYCSPRRSLTPPPKMMAPEYDSPRGLPIPPSASSPSRALSLSAYSNVPQDMDSQFQDDGPTDLFEISKQDIRELNPFLPIEQPPPPPQFVEDILYYRYGFSLDETNYSGVPSSVSFKRTFKTWTMACRGVGAQHLETQCKKNQQPIIDFLDILASSSRAIHELPAKYWDLSPANSRPLKAIPQINFSIEVKHFAGHAPLCLLHPKCMNRKDLPSWLLAVPPITALEVIRRGLGPDPAETTEYLIDHGMVFHTLQRLRAPVPQVSPSRSSPRSNPRSNPRCLLGLRSADYKFDQTDYASYETIRDSYLLAHNHSRAALSAGGVIARIAREVLSDSVVLSGPSQDALNGNQDVFKCGNEVYVDDCLSDQVKSLICGSYQKEPAGIFSWYPREGAWNSSGFNIGHWNQECENWFIGRRNDIIDNGSDVINSADWRTNLRMTRVGLKATFNMNKAALNYLQSMQASVFTSHT